MVPKMLILYLLLRTGHGQLRRETRFLTARIKSAVDTSDANAVSTAIAAMDVAVKRFVFDFDAEGVRLAVFDVRILERTRTICDSVVGKGVARIMTYAKIKPPHACVIKNSPSPFRGPLYSFHCAPGPPILTRIVG